MFAASLIANGAPATFTNAETDPSTGFSRAVIVPPSALAHTAQFLPLNEAGEVVGKGQPEAQAGRVLDHLSAALGEARTSLDSAVKLNVYARDAETVAVVKRVLGERVRGPVKPAVTFVTGRLTHADALVAMDAVAVTPLARAQVTYLRREKLFGADASHVAVLPAGGHVYIAGQAEPGALAEATRKTMESLRSTLKFLGLDHAQVVSVKSFIQPISSVPEARAEIVKHFGGQRVPPLVFVEWTMTSPIEIEMVVAAGEASKASAEVVEYLTPPGMTASPIYSRVARVNRGDLIYTGGLYGPSGASGEAQVRDLFAQLKELMEKSGSDMRHMAKATYYVSDNDASTMLNKIRPGFYDPKRPPAASKALVPGVGLEGRSITLDMIAVRRTGAAGSP
ncbi:MAG: RidA family protein [Verrucomicrobia bacterium]|nr:RidA family protein [Verrucomicrobiota bacterium]